MNATTDSGAGHAPPPAPQPFSQNGQTPPPNAGQNQDAARIVRSNNKMVPLIIVAVVLLLLGGIAFMSGLFGHRGEKPEATETVDLNPPDASDKSQSGQDPTEKYSASFNSASLNPSKVSSLADEQARVETSTLTGKDLTRRGRLSNEQVTIPPDEPMAGYSAPRSKADVDRRFRADQARMNRDNQRVIQTMYATPETAAEKRLRLEQQEEKRYARAQQDRMLSLSEKAINQQLAGPDANPSNGAVATTSVTGSRKTAVDNLPEANGGPLLMEQYYELKGLTGGNLTPQYQRMFAREIEAERSAQNVGAVTTVINKQAGVATRSRSIEGTTFYTQNGRSVAPQQSLSSRNLAIPAVIHGDADNVVIRNGSTVSIRLTQDTQLLLNGDRLFLPANSLISGVCSISGERIIVRVGNIRQGVYLYQADLTAYDLDGQMGIRVPDLADKNKAAQQMVQAGSQSASSPMMLIPQGSAANQIGTQVGVQAASTLFSSIRQYAVTKMASARITIRPNYQILLKAGQSGRSSKVFAANEDDSQ